MEIADNGTPQDQDLQDNTNQSAPVEKPVADKVFTQSELNRIVGRVREETREDTYNRVKAEYESQPQTQKPQSMGGMDQLHPDQINQIIEQKLQERVQYAEAQQTVSNFINKVKNAEAKYPGLEEKVEKLNLAAAPHLVQWANSFDNTAEIMKEFVDNPAKYAQVITLSTISPDSARQLMQTLSDSIKKNQSALQEPQVDEPLSQISPSNVADNGKMTTDDYKKMDWLRG